MRRLNKAQAGLFFAAIAAFVVVMLFVLGFVFSEIGALNIHHTMKLSMDLSDKGRMMSSLMVSGKELPNMELLGHSLTSDFDNTGLEPVRKTMTAIGATYLALNRDPIQGSPTETGSTAEVPVPGAGRAPQGAKTGVSLG